MGLKAQHQIYNHDFVTKQDYERAMDRKINEVESDLRKLKRIENDIQNNPFNSQLNEKFIYKIEEIVLEYESVLNQLKSNKMELR